jgi:transketolase
MSVDTVVKPRAMRDAMLSSLHCAMQTDSDLFFVTADFGSPVLDAIRADCPDRFINVGSPSRT